MYWSRMFVPRWHGIASWLMFFVRSGGTDAEVVE